MKGGITHRIEETVKALDQKQLKKALSLTDSIPKLERHHEWVSEAAQTCLANKDDCEAAIKTARDKVGSTTQLPEDSTDLEGLEEYLKPEGGPMEEIAEAEKTDEQLYEECEECHVTNAVVQFHDIAEGCGDTETTDAITQTAENQDTPPGAWVKQLVVIAEKPSCGQEAYKAALGELTDYLQKRDSPILKKLDEGVPSG